MVDRRAVPGLLAAVGGVLVAVGALVGGVPLLAPVAAACGVAAGAATLRLVRHLAAAERQLAGSTEVARVLASLPVAKEVRSLVDRETGLPDGRFFSLAVETAVASGRRRLSPVTVVLLQVDPGPRSLGGNRRHDAIRAAAAAAKSTLRGSDVACRIGEAELGLVLADTTEEGGVWAAGRLQAALSPETVGVRRLAAGVATYPTHALRTEEVVAAARAALTRACTLWAGPGLGRVEVAQPDFA
jgi:diguanylate cyclase (GGDEF)-like protein